MTLLSKVDKQIIQQTPDILYLMDEHKPSQQTTLCKGSDTKTQLPDMENGAYVMYHL